MADTVKYFGCRSHNERRELQASSIGEALSLLQPGEILSSERTAPVEEQIRHHAETAIRYQGLHRSTLSIIRKRALAGNVSGRGYALLMNDLRVYREMFASARARLRALIAAATSCESTPLSHRRQSARAAHVSP
jgi:hypothetical protein